jgi:integrase
MKLTAKAVAALTLDGKTDLIVFDDAMPGFGFRLRVGAGGKILRSWIVQYRHGGATRRLLLGPAGVLNAEQARTMAKKALGRVANGEDPQASKLDCRARDAHTLKATVADYLAMKQRVVRSRTYTEMARYLAGGYFKPLHSLALDQISRKDVAARLNRITLESGGIVAGRARAQLNALFVWALAHGLCETNPVVGTAPPKGGQPRERVLSDAELAAIWKACGDDDYGRCIRLLILLGARRQEIGGSCWREFDFERGTWTLPASRSKNGRAHTLPLLPAVRAIISAVPCMASRDQLFGARANGFTGWQRGKAALDQRSGVRGWCVHDVRRSVATRLADLGVLPHVIEQILNHQSGHRAGPAGIYNRSSYEREVTAALARWEDHIRSLVAGGKRKVLAFRQQLILEGQQRPS